jgi:Raf kinase inhibitor-like YbhB/YbcL family protein
MRLTFGVLTAFAGSAVLAALPAIAQNRPQEKPPFSTWQLQDPKSANVEITGHVLEPKQLEPTDERLARLNLPDGFKIGVFARDLINPRMLAVADDGTVYVTRRAVGDVVMLRDEDSDGKADVRRTVASRPMMHGVAIDGDTVYLTTVAEVYRAKIREDGTLAPLERIIHDRPAGGQHPNRMVVVGPDGKLYVSVGSTCNACAETDPEHATILQIEPDGSSRKIFASGLRNTIGYGFHPETGELYGMDHGIDWLGDSEQGEELNHIVEGHKYGWPYVFADSKFNPQDEPPGGISMEEWAAQSTEPVGLYTPHAAPMQLAWYTGEQFPAEYRGDALVAMRGSWNRKPPSGYEVLRIRFEDGRPVALEPFVTGFLMDTEDGGWGHLGRLAGLAMAADGSLLLADDANGVIYRISYEGGQETAQQGAGPDQPTNRARSQVRVEPAGGPPAPPEKPSDQLAAAIVGAADGTIEITTPAFENGKPIPGIYAAEQQNISPPLEWAEGPGGTRSYAIVMEDPDASRDPPFVHWMLYNLPPHVTDLREGIPGQPRLELPPGALQGVNDRGSIGYFGMRPPKGDPAHHYHVQIFALDTMLDLPHGTSRARLLDAMQGHVLAKGEIVGTYKRS